MTHSVYSDSRMSDNERHAAMYDGQLFVDSSLSSVRKFAEFAQQMIEDAFARSYGGCRGSDSPAAMRPESATVQTMRPPRKSRRS